MILVIHFLIGLFDWLHHLGICPIGKACPQEHGSKESPDCSLPPSAQSFCPLNSRPFNFISFWCHLYQQAITHFSLAFPPYVIFFFLPKEFDAQLPVISYLHLMDS